MPHTRRRNDWQPHRLPATGKPALKTPTTTLLTQAESRTSLFDLPALNSMRPTAPSSRPYGRDAVGLRPSLDPDAYFDAPNQDQEARRTSKTNTEVGLDRPHSFRNDLHKSWWARTVSNRRPLVCKTRALPLSYAPHARRRLHARRPAPKTFKPLKPPARQSTAAGRGLHRAVSSRRNG